MKAYFVTLSLLIGWLAGVGTLHIFNGATKDIKRLQTGNVAVPHQLEYPDTTQGMNLEINDSAVHFLIYGSCINVSQEQVKFTPRCHGIIVSVFCDSILIDYKPGWDGVQNINDMHEVQLHHQDEQDPFAVEYFDISESCVDYLLETIAQGGKTQSRNKEADRWSLVSYVDERTVEVNDRGRLILKYLSR